MLSCSECVDVRAMCQRGEDGRMRSSLRSGPSLCDCAIGALGGSPIEVHELRHPVDVSDILEAQGNHLFTFATPCLLEPASAGTRLESWNLREYRISGLPGLGNSGNSHSWATASDM
eukprot:6872259-Pyramimonas_sp.AAC.1